MASGAHWGALKVAAAAITAAPGSGLWVGLWGPELAVETSSRTRNTSLVVIAARGRRVSVATRVCPRRMKVDGHVLCHRCVALRLHGR